MPAQSDQIFDGKPVLQFRDENGRRSFLRHALLVGVGATYVAVAAGDPGIFRGAVSADAAPAVTAAPKAAKSDLDILNYALTLEYLESAFYTKGVSAGILKGRDLALVSPIRDHEAEHVRAITATIKGLGGTPVAKPAIKFPAGTFASRSSFLKTASVFEELGVKAYHGQVPLVKDVAILAAAASIAGVESRHAAIVADLIGGNPFPRPIEAHLPMSAVLKAAMPFLGK